jgi:CBS domain-containing protein
MTMAGTLVKDALSQSFIVLDPAITAKEALHQMRGQNAIYGVVPDTQIAMPALVTIGFFDQTQDQQATVGGLTAKLAHLTPVPSTVSLEQAASLLATFFRANRNLAGLVIVDDQQQVIGIVPRQNLARAADRLVERGGDISRLEGEPILTVGTYYYCSKHNEKELITYWEYDNPPRCSKGDLMEPKP